MIDFSDLDDGLAFRPAATASDAAIRQNAHIANGGEAAFPCPKCNGSGVFGRFGRCFKCEGRGKVSQGVVAAAKGIATAASNRAAFFASNRDLVEALRQIAPWHDFAASLLQQAEAKGGLSERQIDAARGALARVAERRAAKQAEGNREAAGKSGTVGVEAINQLFQTAIGNGLKAPIFRTERLVIKPAKRHADTLYITDTSLGGEYVGKIVNGQFLARREAQPDTLPLLCAIASDPLKAATEYGRSTGACGCCGRELTDPKSVAAGIGPICATKWGL